jgi:hypothetical protein
VASERLELRGESVMRMRKQLVLGGREDVEEAKV